MSQYPEGTEMMQTEGLLYPSVSVSYTPTNGGTAVLPEVPNDMFVSLNPATDIATFTLVLPPESMGRNNQALRIRTSRNINSLLIKGAQTVDNSDVMLPANGVTVFFKFAPNTWSRTV